MLVRVTTVAQQLLESRVLAGSCVLDATVGHGHDTLWMAQRVGATGKVWGIDRQAEAIDHTRARLVELDYQERVELWTCAHAQLAGREGGPPLASLDAAIVNLGYLPGGDESLCTEPAQSELLLRWLLPRLRPGGRMVCCVYPGHAQGCEESRWALQMAQDFPWGWGHSWVHKIANRSERCPWIWSVDRAAKPGRVLELPSAL